jgi:putative SOS response-associated peptidase YedK
VLPANGFYEWRGSARKRPYWMTAEDSLMYFAAIWEAYPVQGHTYFSAAVVTLPTANQRRPLMLDQTGMAAWLNPETPLEALRALLVAPQSALRERPLATFVNDPKLDAPECLTPVN